MIRRLFIKLGLRGKRHKIREQMKLAALLVAGIGS